MNTTNESVELPALKSSMSFGEESGVLRPEERLSLSGEDDLTPPARGQNHSEKLSTELLQEIFRLCPRSLFGWNSAPWVFTRICRRWREIARNDLLLWTEIPINVTSKVAQMPAWKRIRALENVLPLTISDETRFQPLPLRVTVNVPNYFDPQPDIQGLCDVLRTSSDRWVALRYSLNEVSPAIHPLSTGFASLEELVLDAHLSSHVGLPANIESFIESVGSSASKLKKVTISGYFAHLDRFTCWPWEQITVLRLINCTIKEVELLRSFLKRSSESLHTLVIKIGHLASSSRMPPVTLPRVRTLNVRSRGRTWCMEGLTAPSLECLELDVPKDSTEEWLSTVIRMVQRSGCGASSRLQTITLRGVTLADVIVETFLRVCGSTVRELTIMGMVLGARLFECIASPPDGVEFLPRLEVLRIRSESRDQQFSPLELLPTLRALERAVRTRPMKELELEVYSDSPEERAVAEQLSRGGCLVKAYYAHGFSPDGRTRLNNVGRMFGWAMKANHLHMDYTAPESIMPVIDELLRVVETYLQEDWVDKEAVKKIPELHNFLSGFAYGKPGLPREAEFNTRGRAKAVLRRLNEIAGLIKG
ncbi:hypothetical protein V5O48_002363 [Marasmius crinis-equi]|uniref:F-box domain-containing protein n=1 Tax=Marasmius crinis-equi TaxID=585013 RepID=A0ABR3FVX6_9AGAR